MNDPENPRLAGVVGEAGRQTLRFTLISERLVYGVGARYYVRGAMDPEYRVEKDLDLKVRRILRGREEILLLAFTPEARAHVAMQAITGWSTR